jgi:hypothetical protein
MRFALGVATVVLCLLACPAPSAFAADAAPQDLGYRTPAQDIADTAAVCAGDAPAQNLVVVATLRGSREVARQGALAQRYYPPLARELVRRGYRVSAREIGYPALPTSALLGHVPEFLRSAVGSGKDIGLQLAALVNRCATRQVVIAGYSQGGIALRSALDSLRSSPAIWRRFSQIDLFGDGSASTAADRGMPTGPTPLAKVPARRGTMGILLFGRNVSAAARSGTVRAFAAIFRADNLKAIASLKPPPSYPAELKPRIDRYCMPEDIVCDTRAAVDGFITRAKDIGCTLGAIGAVACATERGWFTSYLASTLGQHKVYRWKNSALDTASGFSPRPALPSRRPPTSAEFAGIAAAVQARPDGSYYCATPGSTWVSGEDANWAVASMRSNCGLGSQTVRFFVSRSSPTVTDWVLRERQYELLGTGLPIPCGSAAVPADIRCG